MEFCLITANQMKGSEESVARSMAVLCCLMSAMSGDSLKLSHSECCSPLNVIGPPSSMLPACWIITRWWYIRTLGQVIFYRAN